MLYMTSTSTPPVRALQLKGTLGKMIQPASRVSRSMLDGLTWCIDNGCFAKGEQFDVDGYLSWLAGLPRIGCLFATAPDVVGNAAATEARSRDILPRIRDLGFSAAFVAQDGLENLSVPWETFDALFVGGSTAWKLSEAAYRLIAQGKEHGKHVHCGRVNSWPRFRAMAMAGCDSADGTMLAFAPDTNLARVVGWIERWNRQPCLLEG